MSERLRFAELFAGAGGLSMGLERAGWECSWHAEIAEAPRAILHHRWPDTPLYGDVTTLDGRALVAAHGPIDLLTGGSPCQDLSVAGKRAGLAGARSGLFYEQMRLWDETGADLCLWENVDGARSSNNGRDFGEVLRAFVGAAVPLPADGWRTAGVAAGPTGVAAWRVLDAQFFEVPQRRRRIFVLGTRAGRVDPAEILSLAEGVCGDSPARGEAGEGVAADARGRVAYSLGSHAGAAEGGVSNESHASGGPVGMGIGEELANSLRAGRVQSVVDVLAFDTLNQDETGRVTHSLRDGHGEGTPVVCLTGEVTHASFAPDVARSLKASGNCKHREDSETYVVANTITAREAKGWNPARDVGNGTVSHGIPRRLTPRECERLQAWPDDHTLVPDAKGKLLSDAARYKACGNGVASVHSHWIGWRLALALTPTPEPSHD